MLTLIEYVRRELKADLSYWVGKLTKAKDKGHPCTGTEALYRPYGP